MNIYVGNLSYRTTEAELKEAFAQFGEVRRAKIVKDRETDRSKGFGFVEMDDANEGQKAIDALNEKELGGRTLRVNEARPRDEGLCATIWWHSLAHSSDAKRLSTRWQRLQLHFDLSFDALTGWRFTLKD